MERKLKFTKANTAAVKGIAIIFLILYHGFSIKSRLYGYPVSFWPLSETTAMAICRVMVQCVGIFAFLSVYGLTLSMKAQYQDYEFTLNVPDNIYVITQTNVGERAKIDNKQEHLKTVAYDVNSEIINKLGNDDNSIGSIIISQDVLNRKQGTLMTLLGSFPSILSLGTLNLIGYPFGTEEYTVQVNAVAYDLNGKQLKEYKATAKDWKFVACYYGYAPDQVQAAAYLSAYKEGLESVIDQINQDSVLHSLMYNKAQNIIKQNKQIALKKKAEEAKRKALEQEAKRKQEAQKQEHIQSVLDELKDI